MSPNTELLREAFWYTSTTGVNQLTSLSLRKLHDSFVYALLDLRRYQLLSDPLVTSLYIHVTHTYYKSMLVLVYELCMHVVGLYGDRLLNGYLARSHDNKLNTRA